MQEEIARLRQEAERDIQAATTVEALEDVRRTYLGRRGRLPALFELLRKLPESERPAIGEALNDARRAIQSQLAQQAERTLREMAHRGEAMPRQFHEVVETKFGLSVGVADELIRGPLGLRLERERIDITLPGWHRHLGRRHILSRTVEEVQEIFIRMGFDLVDGTEMETDECNFEHLNIPRDHPARDTMDTFYISDDLLLRTHTTVVDARIMRGRRPPMRVLTAGRCYRRDVVDATHMPVFHQVDGFMVGEGITFADLKGVLIAFAREMFGPEARVRFQPSYFPFTEPSAEVAVWFNGIWLELGGCGMFHPRVLEMAGIDPERYTAFAFGGFGDRVVMARYGIPDIRLFWENDLRLLRQF